MHNAASRELVSLFGLFIVSRDSSHLPHHQLTGVGPRQFIRETAHFPCQSSLGRCVPLPAAV